MSVISILVVIIIVFTLAIILILARLIWRKSRTAVNDQYRDVRYEKYSQMIDETVAHKPGAEGKTDITKESGDEEVLETLLHGKLEYIKGEDRDLVAEKIKEIGLTEEYVEGLSSSDPVKRARSLEVLGDLNVVDLSDRFVQALDDDDRDVRLTAARGLVNMINEIRTTGKDAEKSKPLIQTLVSLLEKPDLWPARRISEIIVGIGPDAIDALLVEFKSPRADIRALVADILGTLGDQRVNEQLIAALSDPDTDVRARAASALGSLGEAQAAKPLIKALQDKAWPVRARAAKSLGKIGDQVAIWPLAELLKDRQWWVRRNAGYALPAFGEPGLEMLEKNLSNPDPFAAERSLEVLEETGRIGKYTGDLGSPNAKERTHAIALLVACGRIGGLAPIIEATKHATDSQSVTSLIEVWRDLTEQLAETLASGDKQTEMRAIESTKKIVYSFVIPNIRSFADLKMAGTETSLAEIDKNVDSIKQAIGYLKQDTDPEIRDEAASTLNFMER